MIKEIFVFILIILFSTFFIPNNCKQKEIIKVDNYDQKGGIKHNKNCGCRLCYKHPTDFQDLKQYNWWDFHDTSGQAVYAEGTLPTFGLWTTKNNLRSPHCIETKFDWRFNFPCENTPFPAECSKSGKCRIRGPLEDTIFKL